jgi:transposase InsO family protein
MWKTLGGFSAQINRFNTFYRFQQLRSTAVKAIFHFSGSPKYEGEVYLRAYSDGWEAEVSLARFLWRHCNVRPHSSLGGRTPHEVYIEIEPCSSRPRPTMSGARTVQ